jgi:hypothetical protein
MAIALEYSNKLSSLKIVYYKIQNANEMALDMKNSKAFSCNNVEKMGVGQSRKRKYRILIIILGAIIYKIFENGGDFVGEMDGPLLFFVLNFSASVSSQFFLHTFAEQLRPVKDF